MFIKLVSEYVKGILIKTEYRFQLLKLPIKIWHNLRFNGPYGPYGGLCDINFLGTENVFPLVILHKHIGPRIKRIKTFLFKRNNSF